MTTLLDAYNDILKRAGEGYANYLDRAREMFWRAVGSIIQSGEYQPHEAVNITTTTRSTVPASAFPLQYFGYVGEIVFSSEYNLHSQDANTSKVDPAHMQEIARHRIAMSKMAGINEVIWAEFPTEIRIVYDEDGYAVTTGNLIVEARRISISPAYITNSKDNENIDVTISITLAARAIELATQMIIQEMRG